MIKRLVAIALSLFVWAPGVFAVNGGVLMLGGMGQRGSEIVKDLIKAGVDVTVMGSPV